MLTALGIMKYPLLQASPASSLPCQGGTPNPHPRNWGSRRAPCGRAQFLSTPGASCDPLHPLVSSPCLWERPLPPFAFPLPILGAKSSKKEQGQVRGPFLAPTVPAESWHFHMLRPVTLAPPRTRTAWMPGSLRGTAVQQGLRVQTPRSPRGWRCRWWLPSARILAPETPGEGS